MNDQATLEKMKQLKFNGMASSFQNMLATGGIHDLSAAEIIAHLIEAEYDERYNRRIKKLIQSANFHQVVHLEELNYDSSRNINKKQILKLIDLNWLSSGENIIITGATGVGKSFLACALGRQVCLQGLRVQYFSINKFFGYLKYEKSCGNYYKKIEYLSKKDVLILDDFGLEMLDKDSRIILFEVLEERYEKKSMIIISQIPIENWYDVIGDKTMADAICDRLISNSYKIELKGDSMRRKKIEKS
jgi:DNA replication protein DnaC